MHSWRGALDGAQNVAGLERAKSTAAKQGAAADDPREGPRSSSEGPSQEETAAAVRAIEHEASELILGIGELVRGLCSSEDAEEAMRIICAGEKYTLRTEKTLESTETELLSLFPHLTQVQANLASIPQMRKQIADTLAALGSPSSSSASAASSKK
mmetsp:Transcript_83/g.200  ORF Transcript_83/g.200 Transcript_83/m.200 type:complete len:156 (-) Transcript_83:846-1313(-)